MAHDVVQIKEFGGGEEICKQDPKSKFNYFHQQAIVMQLKTLQVGPKHKP